MAKTLTSKEYDAMAQRLERMSDGIGHHKSESGFPVRLDETKRRDMRKALEDLRAKWEALVTQAGLAYDGYFGHYKACQSELAQDDDAVRGFYGKYNLVVADFGTKPMSKPKGKTRKAKQ